MINKVMKKSPNNLFISSLKKIISELKPYKKLIIIAIIFALVGTFFSVIAPNKLSELTDEISKGLIIQHDNLNTLINKTKEDEILNEIKIDDTIISVEDQIEFKTIMETIEDDSSDLELYRKIDDMPQNIQHVILPFMNMEKIKQHTLILVAMYVISAICMYVQGEKMADVTNGFAKNLRTRVSEKINKLPLKYFDKHETGEILSRTTNDIDTIAQSMNQSLEDFASSVILIIGTVFMMFLTNWIMAITAIFSTWIAIILSTIILKKSQKYFIARQKELGELNNHIEETYSSMRIVKSLNGKKQSFREFEKLNKKVYKANRKSQFFSGLVQPITDLIGNLGYVAVCIVGAILTMNNMISFGVIIAFIAYVKTFTSPLLNLAQATSFFQITVAASQRVFEFLDEKEMSSQTNILKRLSKYEIKGKIDFENVCFTYNGRKIPTIKDLSVSIEPGQKVAIVGMPGARKNNVS